MKQILMMAMAVWMLMAGGNGLRQVVLTPTPKMHCESCEQKIKGNLRFEKGVSKIETNVEQQRVTVTYNPRKTSPEALQAAMKKIGYETIVVSDQAVTTRSKVTAAQPARQRK